MGEITKGQLRELLDREERGDFGNEAGNDFQWFADNWETVRGLRTGKFTVAASGTVAAPTVEPKPLTGRVIKTITVPAYTARNFAGAVRLGQFDNARDLGDATRQFGNEQVGLDQPVPIDLVEFNRDWWKDEAIAWGLANGGKKSIDIAHLLGIAIALPDEQRVRPIVELSSVRGGGVLCLSGNSDWRRLRRLTVESYWLRFCLVGFVSE